MTSKDVSTALQSLQTELATTIRQRDQLNLRIMQLQNNIISLRGLLVKDLVQADAQRLALGLTEAIRTILRTTQKPMSPAEVKNALVIAGFNFAGFSNPSAAVHNTLKRMAKTGEIRFIPFGKTYRMPSPFYGE